MKKIILIAIAFLGFATATAQVTIKPGVRAGLNFSKFTNSDSDLKADFFIGGSMAIKFAKIYTLQPELSYSRQGARVVDYYNYNYNPFDPIVLPSQRVERKYQADYLSLGIINKFTFGKYFQVHVGPSLDFKVDDNFASYGSESPEDLDISLVAGVGFAFNNGFAVDLRIKQGMIDIFGNNYNYDNEYYYEDSNGNIDDIILNQVIQLGVSYTFDGKKK